MDSLKALPGVGELHEAAVEAHRAKRDELLQQESYQKMRETLLQASPYPPGEEKLMKEIGLL